MLQIQLSVFFAKSLSPVNTSRMGAARGDRDRRRQR
jgi:hypothetical protein